MHGIASAIEISSTCNLVEAGLNLEGRISFQWLQTGVFVQGKISDTNVHTVVNLINQNTSV